MTTQNVHDLIKNYNIYRVFVCVSNDCEYRNDLELDLCQKRILLVDHWLNIVSETEKNVLVRHLIDGISWSRLSDENSRNGIAYDQRAMQRAQQRGIRKILDFTTMSFGSSLDYLIDEEVSQKSRRFAGE